MLKPGDMAPDFTLASVDGESVTLSKVTGDGGHNVLLVFLRHLG